MDHPKDQPLCLVLDFQGICIHFIILNPSKIEWDLRAVRYSGFFGVRSVGPTVGDFLD